jgi:hypothetical protein
LNAVRDTPATHLQFPDRPLQLLIIHDLPPLFEDVCAKRFNLPWQSNRDDFPAVDFHHRFTLGLALAWQVRWKGNNRMLTFGSTLLLLRSGVEICAEGGKEAV